MSFVNYEELKQEIIGTNLPRPLSGTLSGHAAGEPFDKHVYSQIKLKFLYMQNLDAIGHKAKHTLFNSPTVMFLLSRGKNATDKWSIENPFEEKQNDTADMLVVKDNYFEIIDIKTRNLSKNAQAPNIISAYKLAQVCAIMLDNNEFNSFTINYFEVDWILEYDNLVCKNTHIVTNLEQSFNGNMKEWAIRYLKHFTTQARIRADDMIHKFVIPFEKYIK